MYSSTLLDIFKSFSPKEIKDFEDFISSPYYNKNKNVIALYKLIKVEYPEFNKNTLAKESVYKKIYKGTKYNDASMRTLIFYLQEAAEKFLAVKNFESDGFSLNKHMLVELNDRDLNKVFQKNYKAATKQIEKTEKRGTPYFLNKFFYEFENLYHLNKLYFDRDEKYVQKINVEDVFSNLTHYYLIRTFGYYLYHLNVRRKFRVDRKFKLFEEMVYTHNTEDYKDVPVVNMFYYCLMLTLKPEQEENYFKAKELMRIHENEFTSIDVAEFYINLENYCKRKFKTDNINFLNELFDIYKAELKKKTYLFRGYMPDLFYKSVMDTAIRLKEFDWVKKFILDYKKELPEEHRENTFLQCMGVYEFNMENYEKALELISKIKFNEVYQKMDVKCLLNAIYYELDIISSLESSIDAFRHFLKNDKIVPDERKVPYAIFNKNLLKLLKLKLKPDVEELELFHDNISVGSYFNKEWLQIKVKELIDKHSKK